MNYVLVYHPKVVKEDLADMDEKTKMRIRTFIGIKLTMAPELFGAPLRTSLKGERKACVGGYRIIYRIQKGTLLVIAIKHYSAMR